MSKPVAVALLVVAVAASLALWPNSPARPADAGTRDLQEDPSTPEVVEGAAPVSDESQPGRRPDRQPAPAASLRAVAEPEAEWDPEARGDLTLRVVDEAGRGVGGAEVEFHGLRSARDPGTHFGWRGDPSAGRTVGDGQVTLEFPVWARRRRPTSKVTVQIDHPHFVSKNEDLAIGSGVHTVVLERGTFVTVSGWIGDRGNAITAVEPHATRQARVSPEDWLTGGGRRPSTHKMAVGYHALFLIHDSGTSRYYSDVVAFALEKGRPVDLAVELRPALALRGRLDDAVPRPVRNGSVMLNAGIRQGPATMGRPFTAPVAADGTFVFDGLPRGPAEVIGICDGWVSTMILPDFAPERFLPEAELHEVVVAEEAGEFVLGMQPAATFVATVVGPEGDPVSGADVALWPNVHWGHGSAHYFMRREYRPETDARGVATICDLPPGTEGFRVRAEGLAMPLRSDRDGRPPQRQGRVELRSGETHEVRVELEVVK